MMAKRCQATVEGHCRYTDGVLQSVFSLKIYIEIEADTVPLITPLCICEQETSLVSTNQLRALSKRLAAKLPGWKR